MIWGFKGMIVICHWLHAPIRNEALRSKMWTKSDGKQQLSSWTLFINVSHVSAGLLCVLQKGPSVSLIYINICKYCLQTTCAQSEWCRSCSWFICRNRVTGRLSPWCWANTEQRLDLSGLSQRILSQMNFTLFWLMSLLLSWWDSLQPE